MIAIGFRDPEILKNNFLKADLTYNRRETINGVRVLIIIN